MENFDVLFTAVVFFHAYCEHIYREEYKHYQRNGVRLICKNSIPKFIVMLLPFKYRHYRKYYSYFFYVYAMVQYSLYFLLMVLLLFDGMQSACGLIMFGDMVISWPLLAIIERNKRS